MVQKIIRLFLRLALGVSFLSAVADRFGYWSEKYSSWGNWYNFVTYTQKINPWLPDSLIEFTAYAATGLEILFGIMLLIGLKTNLIAKLSGFLLLIFAFSMAFSIGIKLAFDYSVFSASAAAFALSLMKVQFLEVDELFNRKRT